MNLLELFSNDHKHNPDLLDSILVDLCQQVIDGKNNNPDYYGMVAAAVLDPESNLVSAVNYKKGNERVHAERAAIDLYNKKYGELPKDSTIITTLSPCSQDMADRHGSSCTDLLDELGVKNVYCGYQDPTQQSGYRVTNNSKIQTLCKAFADTFLEVTENFDNGKNTYKKYTIKKSYTMSKAGVEKSVWHIMDGDFVVDVTDLRRDAKYYADKWNAAEEESSNASQNLHKQGVAEGEIVPLGKKHRGDLDSVNSCSKCGGKLEGGTYMGQRIKVCQPCKQVYLPPNSGIDQQGNKTNVQGMAENFDDGKNPGRKGLSKRVGIPKKATLGKLEKIAGSSTGERRRMAQWQLNMRRGKKK